MYPPETLIDNRYLVKDILGKGGMGTVYSTIESSLNRKVAVKVLHSNLGLDNEMHARFDREAQCLSRIAHKNIVTVYRLGEWRNSLYVAMEQVEGETLETRLKEGKMPVQSALELIAEIAGAMEFAHEAGIVHRDLKPANIILTNEGTPKILDFGLCRDLRSDQEVQKLTATGILLGSINYMSPEACAGLPATHLSDIYSLGVILYQCVSGAPPFSADTPIGTLYLHKHQNAPLLKASDCGRSAELNELLSKCLAKKPSQRYQSMEELRTAILFMLSKQAEKKRPPVILIAAASSILILTTIALSTILPKLNLRKPSRSDTPSLGIEQNRSKNFQTLGPLASKPIIDKAWGLWLENDASKAFSVLDPYLASPKLKPRTRIIMEAQKARMLLTEPEKSKPLWEKAFKLAQKELEKSNDTDSNHLFFATGRNYAESLAATGQLAEAEALLNKLIHTERDPGFGGSQLSPMLPAPNRQDLLLARADVALQRHDQKTANKIADQLVAEGYGDLSTAGKTGSLLLKLNRDKDVRALITTLTPADTTIVTPLHEYMRAAAAQLLHIGKQAGDAKKWQLAKAAFDSAELINDSRNDIVLGGVGLRWKLPLEEVELLYKQNRKAEADKRLNELTEIWLRENREEISNYKSQNPLPLIIALLAHRCQSDATRIISAAKDNLNLYAPDLDSGVNDTFEANRNIVLRALKPYLKDPLIAEFYKQVREKK